MTALLLAVAPAAAKEVKSAEVCGASGCKDVKDPSEQMLGGSSMVDGPTKGEPFVRLRFDVRAGPEHVVVRTIFAPRSGLVRMEEGGWMVPSGLAALRAAARTVEPFLAARMPGIQAVPTTPTPAGPVPADPVPAASDDGVFPWWVVLVAVPIGLAVLLARRYRGRALRTG